MFIASANARGIAFTCLAMFCFISNDVVVKAMGQSLPADQIMILRGLLSGAVLIVMLCAMGGLSKWRMTLQWPALLRTFCDAVATLTYIGALVGMNVASLVAISQVVPILTTAAGAVLFKEHVGPRRWLALAIGFAGVLAVVRPGIVPLDVPMLLAIASVLLLTTRDIATRKTESNMPALLIAASATLAVPLITLPISSTGAWMPIFWQDGALLLLIALGIAAGNWMLILAIRTSSFSAIAPFRYSAIPFAVVLSMVFFGELPDQMTIIGSVLIIVGGVFSMQDPTLNKGQQPDERCSPQ